jgi:hypothetical protein
VQLKRLLTCSKIVSYKTVPVRADGTFTVALKKAAPPEQFALYRVVAAIGRGSGYTLPIAV